MRKFALGLVLASMCLAMPGCGGCGGSGMSEAQMRARSRIRSADELDSAELESAPKPPANGSNQETGGTSGPNRSRPAANSPTQKVAKQAAAPQATGRNLPDDEVPANGADTSPPRSSAPSRGPMARSTAPAPPRYSPAAEHLAAPIPAETLAEVGAVTVVIPAPASGEPLSPQDCRARTIDNLRRIGAALQAYVQKYGALPPHAIRNQAGEPTLSWRVALLPQLGYEALYKQFRLHEPWDSPHNRQLTAQIPPELQSPERRDQATNYLAVIGPDTALGGLRGAHPDSFEDGAENSLLVVEASDEAAVPWTQPSDLRLKFDLPRAGIGQLREDGTLALAGDGRVWRIPPELPAHVLAALLTTDHGEVVSASAVLQEPTREVASGTVAVANIDPLADLLPGNPNNATAAPIDPPSLPSRPGDASAVKMPVPDEASLAKSLELLKTLYSKEAEQARKPDQRAKVVGTLMSEATKVQDNPADYYELMRIVREMAVSIGDVTSALKAVDLVEQKFAVDGIALRLKALEDLAKTVRSANGAQAKVETLVDEAQRLVALAIESDNFEQAQRAQEHWLAFARIQGGRADIQAATQAKTAVEVARKSFAAVPDAMKKLQTDPNDALANETVGRYLCLVKGHWHEGLPLLVRGADVNLRVVATIDLETTRSPQQTAALADKYWEMASDQKPPHTRNLHLRAVFYYQSAAAQLAGGLEKVKAQKRFEECKQMYGAAEVTKALQQMNVGPGLPVAAVSGE
jgi:hypothetical protein